jgi:hypothetical protein
VQTQLAEVFALHYQPVVRPIRQDVCGQTHDVGVVGDKWRVIQEAIAEGDAVAHVDAHLLGQFNVSAAELD